MQYYLFISLFIFTSCFSMQPEQRLVVYVPPSSIDHQSKRQRIERISDIYQTRLARHNPFFDRMALHKACNRGHVDRARFLIAQFGTGIINVKDRQGNTPMHIVARQYFSDNDDYYNAYQNIEERNAANYALAQLLIQHRAHVHTLNQSRHSPIYKACMHGQENILALLIQSPQAKEKPVDIKLLHTLFFANRHNSTQSIYNRADMLLSCHVDINATPSGTHTTLLHKAALKRNIPLMKYCIDRGADCDIPDEKGNTALHYAAANNCIESVRVLLPESHTEPQANAFILNENQQTADQLATNPGVKTWIIESQNAFQSHFK